jgi:hypothetical protein
MTKKRQFTDPNSAATGSVWTPAKLDDVLGDDRPLSKKLVKSKTKADDLVSIVAQWAILTKHIIELDRSPNNARRGESRVCKLALLGHFGGQFFEPLDGVDRRARLVVYGRDKHLATVTDDAHGVFVGIHNMADCEVAEIVGIAGASVANVDALVKLPTMLARVAFGVQQGSECLEFIIAHVPDCGCDLLQPMELATVTYQEERVRAV